MLRISLIQLASFLLPFIIFFVWRWQLSAERPLNATPTLKLAAIGAALAVVAMLVMVMLDAADSGRAGDRYVPPRVVDGRVVPGHFIPAGEAEGEAEEDAERDASRPQ